MSNIDIENEGIAALTSKEYLKEMPDEAVINLDNYGHGTHWTGIKTIGDNEYEYKDSFGVKPPFHIPGGLIEYSPYVEQKEWEVNCGQRSIDFIKGKGLQSIVFDKDKWSIPSAEKWLAGNNHKWNKVDEKTNTYRFRQEEPIKGDYRSKKLKNGITMVYSK